MSSRPARTHGFSFPLHSQQIFAWTLFTFHTVSAAGFILPILPLPSQIAFGLCYFGPMVVVVRAAYVTTSCNPTDSLVKQRKLSHSQGYLTSSWHLETSVSKATCDLCQSPVNLNSKHCGYCDRCVEGFDHHCKWVNNCIGKANYRSFCLLIGSLLAAETTLCVCCAWLTSQLVQSSAAYKSMQEDSHLAVSVDTLAAVHISTLVSGAIVWVGLLCLGCLHTLLCVKQMTTYDFICALRKAKVEAVSSGVNRLPSLIRLEQAVNSLEMQDEEAVHEQPRSQDLEGNEADD